MLALAAAWGLVQQSAAREVRFSVPPGFVVDRPAEIADSWISLAFDPAGNAYIGRESAGIVRLSDPDRNGVFDRSDEIAAELATCQGLLVEGSSLFATGLREGRPGLWRVPLDDRGLRAGEIELVFEFTDGGEHGVHALVRGQEGSIYVSVGNHAAFADPGAAASGLWSGDEGRLLAPYMDPLGHGTRVRYPAGFVARLDLSTRTCHYVAVGLRNAYDLAIDPSGRMFAVDSDMEWDIGLPWYRPVRVLEIVEGGDYGSRAGSSVIPDWCVDTQPARLDLGRGSPTGAVFGSAARFPGEFRSALFSGDWSRGRILAIWPGRDGSGSKPRSADFLSADAALPVTDLAIGPEGGLWFITGGRGARGGVFRVLHPGEVEELPAPRVSKLDERRSRLEADARRLARGERDSVETRTLEALKHFDRETWPLELRVVGAIATPAEIEELSRSEHFEQRLGALFLFARRASIDGESDRFAASALAALDDAARAGDSRAESTLAVLRATELGFLRGARPSGDLLTRLVTRWLEMFPAEDERAARELAVLLSHADDPRALRPLFDAMLESPQELAIHYVDCLHRMTRGWDAPSRLGMLEWFARSNGYSGGISLLGYLSAMRARFIGNLPLEACAELASAQSLEAESLALLLARLPEELALLRLPHFESALARIVAARFGTREQVRKDAALRALLPLQLPAVGELARKLARSEGDVLEAPWTLLARTPEARDFELWLSAIVQPSLVKRETAFEALARIARAPGSADDWRALIDHAREIGARRGRELARTLARWCREAGGTAPEGGLAESREFEAALAALESWYAQRFPQGKPATNLDPLPRWSEERLRAFLARARERPGSSAHGRAVFESAGCNACHAVGASPAIDRRGFGPDLANVADRMSDDDLLSALLAPSRVVSDQYRAHIARTLDERIFEGIVTRRDARGISIQPVGGEPIEIEIEELEALEPSPRSPMPDGLMDSRTLEELRDLIAYMKHPVPESAPRGWSPLLGAGGLGGWDGDPAVWSLRGSALIGRSMGIEKSSYILAPMPAQDLWIEFDVFLPPGGNSGLCYRAKRPSDPGVFDPSGAQADLGQSYWGTLYASDRGTLTQTDAAALATALDREGWNHVLVRFEGDQHSMELNGLQTYSAREKTPPGTLLGFQVHQGKPMQVRIANARWRRP